MSTENTTRGVASGWSRWAPDLGAGSAVAVLGLLEALSTTAYPYSGRGALTVVAVVTGAAVGLSRRAPGAALALVWALFVLQVLSGTQVMFVELAVAAVAFGTARWGGAVTLVLSGLSIPLVALLALLAMSTGVFIPDVGQVVSQLFLGTVARFGNTSLAAAGLFGMFGLSAPWLAGLAWRFRDNARDSQVSQVAAEQDRAVAEREAHQAQEIARLREQQARLARDVHDVVGHSLAVILAQAESAQFLRDDDHEGLKRTMATIATSARTSLQDVRAVLSTDPAQPPAAHTGGLESLVEGVRASGHQVHSTEVGTPQPLPPELDVVAFRVLQEMLTNAIRHGSRGAPVSVERHWDGELRIEVRNVVEESESEETRPVQVVGDQGPPGGQGLVGMRRRLEAVGGRLDVRRRQEPTGATFTVTAWVPVRVGA